MILAIAANEAVQTLDTNHWMVLKSFGNAYW